MAERYIVVSAFAHKGDLIADHVVHVAHLIDGPPPSEQAINHCLNLYPIEDGWIGHGVSWAVIEAVSLRATGKKGQGYG